MTGGESVQPSYDREKPATILEKKKKEKKNFAGRARDGLEPHTYPLFPFSKTAKPQKQLFWGWQARQVGRWTSFPTREGNENAVGTGFETKLTGWLFLPPPRGVLGLDLLAETCGKACAE